MKKTALNIASRALGILFAVIFISPPVMSPEMQQWLQEERTRQEYQRQEALQWQQQERMRQLQQQYQTFQLQQQERAIQLQQQNQWLQRQMQERARQFPPRPWP
jgi:hypothetical protein